MGLSTAWNLSRRVSGKIAVLDRHAIPNEEGSSGDAVRMFRTMYTEDFMADLARDTTPLWRELEAAGKVKLIEWAGLLNFGDPKYGAAGPEGSLLDPAVHCDRLHTPYKLLTRDEIHEQHHFQQLPNGTLGMFSKNNGVINVPLLSDTLKRLCIENGVEMFEHTQVTKLQADSAGITVFATTPSHGDHTIEGEPVANLQFRANKVALTVGAYTNHVLRPSFGLEADLDIWELTAAWYPLSLRGRSPTASSSMWFQFANDDFGMDDTSNAADSKVSRSNLFYGFPPVDWVQHDPLRAGCVRIALDDATCRITEPEHRHAEVNKDDIARTANFIRQHMPSVNPVPKTTLSCLQTNVFDNMFMLGLLPPSGGEGHARVALFAAGWGMKFVPLVGSVLADLLIDESTTVPHIDKFSLSRPDTNGIPLVHKVSAAPTGRHSLTPLGAASSSGDAPRAPRAPSGSSIPRPKMNRGYANTTVPPMKLATADPTSQTLYSTASKEMRGPSQRWSRAAFARKVLDSSLPRQLYLDTPLLKSAVPRKRTASGSLCVGIVGAGMAGLQAALLLRYVGVKCEILEASPQHFGGRIRTHQFGANGGTPGTSDSLAPGSFNREARAAGKYVDLGAMRFPVIPTMDPVIGKQEWSLTSFLNAHTKDAAESDPPIKLVPYLMSDCKSLSLFNGVLAPATADLHDDPFHFGDKNDGWVPQEYVKEGPDFWLNKAYGSFKDAMRCGFKEGYKLLMQHDHMSTRAYMRANLTLEPSAAAPLCPEPVVQWLETSDSATGLYDNAFVESVMDSFDFESSEWVRIEGGADSLTRAMVKAVQTDIVFPPLPGPAVKIHYGCRAKSVGSWNEETQTIGVYVDPSPKSKPNIVHDDTDTIFSYTHVVLTPPLGVLRSWDWTNCPLTGEKHTAMRVLHYDDSVKLAVRFGRRWWNDLGISGGKAVTDRPLRTIVFPSSTESSVLMVSYTWSQDARRMAGISGRNRAFVRPAVSVELQEADAALAEFIMAGLREIFGQKSVPADDDRTSGWQEVVIWDWSQHPEALGAFALFGPGQFTSLYPAMFTAEQSGHLHFAGEATSVHHAWVVGAVASAYMAVNAILEKDGTAEQRERLKFWRMHADDSEPQEPSALGKRSRTNFEKALPSSSNPSLIAQARTPNLRNASKYA
jgi:sarcosine oxidase/L-pipecolate oxidase